MSKPRNINSLLGLEPIDQYGRPLSTLGKLEDEANGDSFTQSVQGFVDLGGDGTLGRPYDYGSQFDVLYRGEEGHDLTQYGSQTGVGMLLGGVGRIVGTGLTKAAEGVSFLGAGFFEAINEAAAMGRGEALEGNFISRAANNGFSEAFHNMEEGIKQDLIPMFESPSFQDKSVFGKLFTPEFWGNQVADGLAFALSSYVPGGVASKIGKAGKIGTRFAKTLRKAKLRKPRVAPDLKGEGAAIQRLADRLDKLSAFTLMTSSEAFFEAKEMQDSILKNEELKKKYTHEQLQQLAADKAAQTFALNLAVLAPSNLLEASTIFKRGTSLLGKPKKASRTNKGIDMDAKSGEYAAKELTQFQKLRRNPAIRTSTEILGNIAAEGFYEENLQYAIQKLAEAEAMGHMPETSGGWLGRNWNKMKNLAAIAAQPLEGAATSEQAESILLGAIIGGGTSVGANVINPNAKAKENKEIDALRDARLEALKKADVNKLDIFQREEAVQVELKKQDDGTFTVSLDGASPTTIGEQKYNEYAAKANIDLQKGESKGTIEGKILTDPKTGEQLIDATKLEQFVANQVRQGEIKDLMNALGQHPEANKHALELARRHQLATMAHAHFEAGMGEELYDKLDMYSDMTEQELELLGIDPSEAAFTSQRVEAAKEFVAHLEDAYNTIQEQMQPTTTSGEDTKTNEARKAIAFDYASRIANIESARQDLMEQVSEEDEALFDAFDARSSNYDQKEFDIFGEFASAKSALESDIRQSKNGPYEKFRDTRRYRKAKKALIKMLNSTAADPIAQLQLEHLDRSLEQVWQQWNKITDPLTGFEYFKKNREKIMRGLINNQADLLFNMLQGGVDSYLEFEERYLPILKIRRKLDRLVREKAGKLWRSRAAQGISFIDIIAELIQNNALLTPQDGQALIDLYEEQYLPAIQELKDKYDQAVADRQDAELDFDMPIEEKQALSDREQELKAELESLERDMQLNVIGNAESVADRINMMVSDSKADLTDDQLRVELLQSFFANPQNVLEAATQIQDYDNLSAIEDAIQETKNLFEIVEHVQSQLEDPTTASIPKQHLKNLMDRLEEVREEVQARMENKLRKEKIKLKRQMIGILEVFERLINNDLLPEEIVELIRPFYDQMMTELHEASEAYEEDENDPLDVGFILPTGVLYKFIDQLKSLDPSVRTIIRNAIETRLEDLGERILNIPGFEDYDKGNRRNAATQVVESMTTNPRRFFKSLLNLIKDGNPRSGSGIDVNTDSSLYRYLQYEDIDDLEMNTEDRSGKITQNALRMAARNAAEMFAFHNLMSELDNESTLHARANQELDTLKKLKTQYEKTGQATPPPSHSQRIAIYQIINELLNFYPSNNRYENMIYLKGPAGSGKTTVVLPWVFKILNHITPNQLYLAGHNERSASTLKEAMAQVPSGTRTVTKLIEELENDNIPEEVQILIIDEIAGISQKELSALTDAIVAYTTRSGKQLMTIVMGDPNQLTKDANVPGIERSSDTGRGLLAGISRMRTVTPITTRYRSDNPAVVTLQDLFLARHTESTPLRGQANVDSKEISTTTKPLLGTYITNSTAKLVETVVNAHKTNPDRTRAIIVDDEASRTKYLDAIRTALGNEVLESKQIEILLVEQAQGSTIDEVYVDITPLDSKKKEKTFEIINYNKKVYTAMSRAKHFIFGANLPTHSNTQDLSLEDRIKRNKEQKKLSFQGDINFLEALLSKYGEIEETEEENTTQEDPTITSEELEEQVKQNEEAKNEVVQEELEEQGNPETPASEKVQKEDERDPGLQIPEPIDPVTVETKEEGDLTNPDLEERTLEDEGTPTPPELSITEGENRMTLQFPQSGVFDPIEESGVEIAPPVKTDGTGRAVVMKIGTSPDNFDLVLAIPASDGSYRIAAYFSEEEYNSLNGAYNIDDMPTYDFDPAGRGMIEVIGEADEVLHAKFLEDSQKLTYYYNSEDVQVSATDILDNWLKYIARPGEIIQNYKEVYDSMRIRIFTDFTANEFEQMNGFRPRTGVPYLTFSGAKVGRAGQQFDRGMKTQIIRLQSRRVRKYSDLVEPLWKFQSIAGMFEAALKKTGVPGLQEAVLGTKQFTELVIKLSNLRYIREGQLNQPKNKLDTSHPFYGDVLKLLESVDGGTAFQLENYAAILDELVHGKIEERNTRRHQGVAQKAMDLIAKSNLYITVGNNQRILARDTRTVRTEAQGDSTAVIKDVFGRSLLGTLSEKGTQVNYDSEIIAYQESYAASLKKRTGQDIPIIKTKDLPPINGKRRTVMSSEEWGQFFEQFDIDGISNHNGGFGLREPLVRSTYDNKHPREIDVDLMENLQTSFVGAFPTRISIAIPNNPTQAREGTSDIQQDLNDAINDATDQPLNDDDLDLFLKEELHEIDEDYDMSEAQLRKLYRAYLPNTLWEAMWMWLSGKTPKGKAGQDVFQMLNQEALHIAAGERVHGFYRKGMLYLMNRKGKGNSIVFAHEMMHVIMQNYLSEAEYNYLIDLARNTVPNLKYASEVQINEYYANRFMEYQKGRERLSITGRLKLLFDKILRYLGFKERYSQDIDNFLMRASNGFYGGKPKRTSDATLYMNELQRNFFNDPALYRSTKQAVLKQVHRLYNGTHPRHPGPRTFDEAIVMAYNDLVSLEAPIRQRLKKLETTLSEMEQDNPTYERLKEQYLKVLEAHRVAFAMKKNKEGFYFLINDLYPDVHLEELFEINDFTTLDALHDNAYIEETDVVNLQQEIDDNETHDPRKNIIKQAKQLLSTIVKSDGSFVEYGQAFVYLLNTLDGIDTSASVIKMKQYIAAQFEQYSSFESAKAVRKFLQNILNKLDGNPTLKHVQFFNEGRILVDTDSQIDTWNINPNQLGENQSLISIERASESSLDEFLTSAVDKINSLARQANPEFKSITKEDLLNQLETYRARNTFANIISSVRSLRQKTNMIGTRRRSKNGGFVYQYFQSRDAGYRSIFFNEMLSSLVSAHTRKLFKDFDFKDFGRTNALVKDKKKALVKLFTVLSIPTGPVNRMTSTEIDPLYGAATHTLRLIEKSTSSDIQDLLFNNPELPRVYADLMSDSTENAAPVNAIRGDGKRIYLRVNSSFSHEVLKYFKSQFAPSSKMELTRPAFLNSAFYKKNIFNNGPSGLNQIFDFVDHDSMKYAGIDASAKLYTKENPLDWLSRNFNAAFVGFLNSSGKTNNTYIQQIFTPSNKPTLTGAVVSVLNRKEIEQAALQMIQQEKERNKDLAIRNYTPEQSYLTGVDLTKSDQENLKQFLENLDKEADALYDFMLERNMNISVETESLINKLKLKGLDKKSLAEDVAMGILNYSPYDDLSTEQQEKLKKQMGVLLEDPKFMEEVKQIRTRAVVREFYANWYVNSHQLNQLLIGDQAFFKNEYNIIKRMSIAIAPGRVGLINERYGMPKKSRVVVLQDFRDIVQEFPGTPKELIGKGIDSADAQGFILPEFAHKMRRSYGLESGLDVVMKPVYYGIGEDGIPRAIKYSSIVLTDELVRDNPGLRRLRDMMRNPGEGQSPIQQAVFESGVKVGVPSKITDLYTDEARTTLFNKDGTPAKIEPTSVFEIDNSNLRIQLNPAHDPISNVTNPSQLTYFPVINPANISKHMKLLQLNAEIIRAGGRLIDRFYRLNKGRPTGPTKIKIKDKVRKALASIRGSEIESALLSLKGISINHPLLTQKVINTVSSHVTKSTVDFKIRGSKLVLQSEYGTFSAQSERLKWKDENNMTEVMIPRALAERYGIHEGGVFTDKNTVFKALGYRLPSTGLHSGIVFKVKKIYDVPAGSMGNVIIAPAQIVEVQGSDYDVDSLFVLLPSRVGDLTRTRTGEEQDLELGKILSVLYENFNTKLVLKKDNLLNYNNAGKRILYDPFGNSTKGASMSLVELLGMALDDIQQEYGEYLRKKNRTPQEAARMELLSVLEKKIISLYSTALKNDIVESFINILSADENRGWMELPITMDRLKKPLRSKARSMLDIIADIRGVEKPKELGNDKTWKDYTRSRQQVLYPKIDLANVLHHMQVHLNTFSGNVLTGASANAVKVLAYIFMGTKTTAWIDQDGKIYRREELKELGDGVVSQGLKRLSEQGIELIDHEKERPLLKKELQVELDGVVYDGLNRAEMKVDEEGNFVPRQVFVGTANGEDVYREISPFETLDSLINAAIDNVKEQLLYLLNLTNNTSNEFFSMVAMGVPLETVTLFFNQEVFLKASREGKRISEDYLQDRKQEYIAEVLALDPDIQSTLQALVENEAETNEEDRQRNRADLKNTLDQQRISLTKALLKKLPSPTETNMLEAAKNFHAGIPTKEDYLLQIALLPRFRKLNKIGQSIFDSSVTLQMLRKLPATYEGGKNMLETFETEVSSPYGRADEDVIQELNEIKEEIKKTAEYEASSNKEVYLNTRAEEIAEDRGTYFRKKNQTYNQMVASKNIRYNRPADNFAFANSSLLSVPNIYRAYLSLRKLVTMIERSFYKYSPSVSKFSKQVATDLKREAKFSESQEDINRNIREDLMQYIFTGINLSVGGDRVDISVPKNLTVKRGDRNVVGHKAWITQLTRHLKQLKRAMNRGVVPYNEFLDRLEIGYDRESKEDLILFTLDKILDPATTQILRQSFVQLAAPSYREIYLGKKSKGVFSQIQLDLLKYLLLSKGLQYGRTSFSRLLPDEMHTAFSQAIETQLSMVLPDDRASNVYSRSLDRLIENFELQYALNNYSDIRQVVEDRIFKQGKEEKKRGRLRGKPYDLAVYSENPTRIVRHFNSVYVYFDSITDTSKGEANAEKIALYRKVGNTKYHKFYKFPSNFINTNTKFDLQTVVSKGTILPKVDFNEERKIYKTLPGAFANLKTKDFVVLHEPTDLAFENLEQYRIVNISKNKDDSRNFKLEKVSNVNPQKTLKPRVTYARSEQRSSKDKASATLHLKRLLDRLSLRFNVPVTYYTDYNSTEFGYADVDGVHINLARATKETALHEFAHFLVHTIKQENTRLYQSLVEEVQRETPEIVAEVEKQYADKDRDTQLEEAVVNAIARYGRGMLPQGILTRLGNLIRQLFAYMRYMIEQSFGLNNPINPAFLNEHTTLAKLGEFMRSPQSFTVLPLNEKKQQRVPDNFSTIAFDSTTDLSKYELPGIEPEVKQALSNVSKAISGIVHRGKKGKPPAFYIHRTSSRLQEVVEKKFDREIPELKQTVALITKDHELHFSVENLNPKTGHSPVKSIYHEAAHAILDYVIDNKELGLIRSMADQIRYLNEQYDSKALQSLVAFSELYPSEALKDLELVTDFIARIAAKEIDLKDFREQGKVKKNVIVQWFQTMLDAIGLGEYIFLDTELDVIDFARGAAEALSTGEVIRSLPMNQRVDRRRELRIDLQRREIDVDIFRLQEDPKTEDQALDAFLDKMEEQQPTLTEDTDGGRYETRGGGVFDRLSNLTRTRFSLREEGRQVTVEEHMAMKAFKNKATSYDGTIVLDNGNTYNMEEAVKYFRSVLRGMRERGKLTHLYMQFLLEKNKAVRDVIKNRITELSKPVIGENGEILRDAFDIKALQWLTKGDKLNQILALSGIKVNIGNDKIYKDKDLDQVLPEVATYSEFLGIGSTIDGIIKHPDGTVSVIDWKTGSLLNDQLSNRILRYGGMRNLLDNKLTRAKLEVAMRAFMMKEHSPNLQFRDLTINYINGNSGVSVFTIELDNYLPVIEAFMKAERPDQYEQARDRGLFEKATYYGTSRITASFQQKLENKSISEQIEWAENEINKLRARYSDVEISEKEWLRKQLAKLGTFRAELESVSGATYDDLTNIEEDKDISVWKRWLGNLKDVDNKYVRGLFSILIKRKANAKQRVEELHKRHDELFKEVVTEYLNSKGMTGLATKITGGRLNFLPLIGGFKQRELFGFMWRYQDPKSSPNPGWHANLQDTYKDPKSGLEVPLTEAQRAYREFYHREMRALYKQVLGKTMYREGKKKVQMWQVVGTKAPEELYQEFMPRTPITMGEIAERAFVPVIQGSMKYYWHNYIGTFIEQNFYSSPTTKGIPLKYYSDQTSVVIEQEAHSLNAEAGFKRFTQSLIMKDELDDVYGAATAVKANIDLQQDSKGNKLYSKLSGFLNDHIQLQILQGTPQEKYTKEDLTFNWGNEKYTVNYRKMMLSLKHFTSAAGMAFKLVNASFNGGLVFMLNYLKAQQGTIAKFMGVPPEDVDFDLKDFTKINAEWFRHLGYWFAGKKNQSKLWDLTQQADFLADNYDYRVKEDGLLSTKNTIMNQSNMYYFHTMFENYGAMMMLGAQVKSIKVDVDGKKVSMWDLYKRNPDTGRFEYTGPIRGKREDGTEIKGITPEEWNKMRRVHESIHGSYRQEERIAGELWVLGQWLLQFKKYLPTLLKQNFQSRQLDQSMGKFVAQRNSDGSLKVGEDGITIYEWEAQMHEGRIRLMMGILMTWVKMGLGKFDPTKDDTSYVWDQMSSERKKQALTVLNTGAVLALLYAVLMAFIPDEDDDKLYAMKIWRVWQDLSQGMNPADILNSLERPTVVIPKVLRMMEGLGMFLSDGLVKGKTTDSGRIPGLRDLTNNLPIFSAIYQWDRMFEEVDDNFVLFGARQR